MNLTQIDTQEIILSLEFRMKELNRLLSFRSLVNRDIWEGSLKNCQDVLEKIKTIQTNLQK